MADPGEFCRAGRLLERNFQNMQENRLPGERPDRHPAAGIWERTSPRFHRDRSRRDACPTLRPRPENNPVKGQARNLFIPDRNYCHYQISRGADGGSRRILRSRPDCWSGISEICWNIDSQVPCRPARPSARAWGRSSTPAFTPFCPKRSRGGRCRHKA